MATWSNRSKNTATWITVPKGYLDLLLKEDGYFLLQESRYKIILDQSATSVSWSNRTKNTATWSNRSKS